MKMKRWIALLLLLVLTAGIVSAYAEIWYVYTKNGKTLNLRSEKDNSVIAHIPYGTALSPDPGKSTELAAYVTYNGKSGYVKWNYLVKEKPKAKGKNAKKQTEEPAPEATQQFSAYEGFAWTDRKAQTAGNVTLRWAPDAEAPGISILQQGTLVEVLQENGTWYQVYEPQSRVCGFLNDTELIEADEEDVPVNG